MALGRERAELVVQGLDPAVRRGAVLAMAELVRRVFAHGAAEVVEESASTEEQPQMKEEGRR